MNGTIEYSSGDVCFDLDIEEVVDGLEGERGEVYDAVSDVEGGEGGVDGDEDHYAF